MTTTESDALAERHWTREGLRALMEEHIPFNRFLGVTLDSVDDEQVTLRLPFRPEFVGDPTRPALHGGVISMLIDTAGGAATFVAARQLSKVSTVDLVVDYLRPGPLLDLVARARVVRRGNRVCIATVVVCAGDDDEPYAQGRGVYNIVPLRDRALDEAGQDVPGRPT